MRRESISTTVFVDGVVAHVPVGRVHACRAALRAPPLGLTSELERPADGRSGHLLFIASLGPKWSRIEEIVRVLEHHGATIERLELAIDQEHGPAELKRAEARVVDTLRIRNKGRCVYPKPRRKPGRSVWYWGSSRAPVNVACYSDRPGKMSWNLWADPVLHLELRFQGWQLNKRGWRRPACLLDFDRCAILDVFESTTTGLRHTLRTARARARCA